MKNLLYYTIAILFLAATACCHKKPKDSPTLQRVSATKVKCTHAMREYEANIISANDEALDIAIVKINATGLPTVKLGNSSLIQTGDKILTIGNPLGLENSISEGLVSSARRTI